MHWKSKTKVIFLFLKNTLLFKIETPLFIFWNVSSFLFFGMFRPFYFYLENYHIQTDEQIDGQQGALLLLRRSATSCIFEILLRKPCL